METLEHILAAHPFCSGLAPERLRLLYGCARNCRFDAGQCLHRACEGADKFFLIRHGRVALEIAEPGGTPFMFATLEEGEIVFAGEPMSPCSWLFDARAIEPTQAISIDTACLRGKCERDYRLGYEMMSRFLPILAKRLHAARLQLLDVYGKR
ncbi:Crp/Fnr family transcriptional regulator (plasmid) [Pandoraea vervacti]|uniref:Crp/Fnr family transcriptional regulator n=1 Tax=Pandoraea vervacti TaxID=656178 RepID=A0ABM5T586_9BURK|nr:cyclic nucleotide-binding domain-containing protein [Pandoraea vervacti]AJP60125.1 Crp/Fnr family transcriptional regulator [Pandoraea vervacti]